MNFLKQNTKKIAIVIPYFKITYFEDNLESLAIQTNKNFKVYIGDDASPEDCSVLLGKYSEKFEFVYKRFEYNLGSTSLVKQWERCIEMIDDEEWFLILGDDDVLALNAIDEFYKAIHATQSSVLRFKTQIINDLGEKNNEIYDYSNVIRSVDFQALNSKHEVRSSLSEYVFKTEKFYKYGVRNYRSAFYSDNWMWLNYSEFGLIESINAKVYIRISDISLSGNHVNKGNVLEASYKFHLDLIIEHSDKFKTREKKIFLPYIIAGYISKKIEVKKLYFYILILKNYSFLDFVLTLMKILKFKKSI